MEAGDYKASPGYSEFWDILDYKVRPCVKRAFIFREKPSSLDTILIQTKSVPWVSHRFGSKKAARKLPKSLARLSRHL